MPRKLRGEENQVKAVKQMFISEKDNIHDKAYRECRILLQLNQLTLQNKCPTFVFLEEWFKSKPPLLFGQVHGHRVAVDEAQYMYFILDYAERVLAGSVLQLEEFRSIAFQLFYALYMAQREFQFMHHDLHPKNILLQDAPASSCLVYHDGGEVWYVKGPVAKIVDFGLSRLRLKGSVPEEVIYNVKDSFSEMFSPQYDVEKLTVELAKCTKEKEAKAFLAAIRKNARSHKPTRDILRHPFFDSLKTRPEELCSEFCRFFSSDGDIERPMAAAKGEAVAPVAVPDLALLRGEVEEEPGAVRMNTRLSLPEKMKYTIWSSSDKKKETKQSIYDLGEDLGEDDLGSDEEYFEATRNGEAVVKKRKKQRDTKDWEEIYSSRFVTKMTEEEKVKAFKEARNMARDLDRIEKERRKAKRERKRSEDTEGTIIIKEEKMMMEDKNEQTFSRYIDELEIMPQEGSFGKRRSFDVLGDKKEEEEEEEKRYEVEKKRRTSLVADAAQSIYGQMQQEEEERAEKEKRRISDLMLHADDT